MKTIKTNEVNLIRSRALTAVFSLILSALLLFPFFASANGKTKPESNGKVYMHALGSNSYATITVADFTESSLIVSIENNAGEDVYTTKIENNGNYSKVFDLSKLENGIYKLKVKGAYTTKERHFVVKDGEIKVKYAEKDQPTFRTVDDKALLTYPNTLNENVSIVIYEANGNILYSTSETDSTIKKVFDFSKVETGNYKVVLSSTGGDYAFNYQNE